MVVLFRRLHHLVSVSISPEKLASAELLDSDFDRWQAYLHDCSLSLRMLMSDQLMGLSGLADKKAWMLSCERHLTELINELNNYLYRGAKLWNGHPRARLIRSHYLRTVDCLQYLLDYASVHFTQFYDFSVPYSEQKLMVVRPHFRKEIGKMRELLSVAEIDPALVDLILRSARNAKRSPSFSPADITYYGQLFDSIRRLPDMNERSLLDLLIVRDFNKPAFFVYLMRGWKEAMLNLEGLHEQLAMMLDKKEEIEGHLVQGPRAFTNHPSLKADLLAYCRRQKEYLQELIELRRMFNQDELDMKEATRIFTGFSVPQITLFFKLQVEKGWIEPKSLASLYRFISSTFYTERAPMVSAHSVKREYEDVKFKTAFKLYLALLEFIEWLDEMFQVKSYRPG